MMGQWNTVDILSGAAAFVLVLALWVVAVLLWKTKKARRAEILHRRLGMGSSNSMRELKLWRDGKEATTKVPGFEPRPTLEQRLDRMRRDAGWDMSVQSLVLTAVGIGVTVFLATYVISGSLLLAGCLLLATAVAIKTYQERCTLKQQEIFESQLVDGLELAARSLRAGHPLLASFRLISEEIPDPIGSVFTKVCQQQGLGLSLEDALRQVALDSRREDLKLFVTSVVIQLRSGGNLADMMGRIAGVVRERMKLARHVRVLISQTQMSKRLLLAVPFVLFTILNIMNPDYMRPLYTTFIGYMLLVAGGVGLLVGAWLMNKMSRLNQ